jgi:hypothetical protein
MNGQAGEDIHLLARFSIGSAVDMKRRSLHINIDSTIFSVKCATLARINNIDAIAANEVDREPICVAYVRDPAEFLAACAWWKAFCTAGRRDQCPNTT